MGRDDKYRNAVDAASTALAKAGQTMAAASVAPLTTASNEVLAMVDRWRDAGRPLLFDTPDELQRFHQHTAERILAQLGALLDRALGILMERLKDPDVNESLDLHEVLRIAESMNTQLSAVRSVAEAGGRRSAPDGDVAPTSPTDDAAILADAVSENEIEARIAELQARKRELLDAE